MPTTKAKTIEVLVKIPANWVQIDGPEVCIGQDIAFRIDGLVIDALADQYLTTLKLPVITITPQEVKDRVIDILAERSIAGTLGPGVIS
jgi:hypothetical protein